MTNQSGKTRSGFAAIIGAPNAGKSTLLNQLVGEKLSIVSSKAQTTRMRVLGLLTEGDTQIGLIDTPGIFAPRDRLDKAMVQAAWQSLDDADAVLLVVDALSDRQENKVEGIIATLKQREIRATLVLNKTDKIKPAALLPMVERFNASGAFDEIFMISALTGDGVAELKSHLKSRMPEGLWLYPADQLTDLSERLLAAEITREQLFRQLREELPYSATVQPESWEEKKDGSVVVRQTIIVNRPNHRAIVLGKNGAQIKSISQKSREELAGITGRVVHLFLEVKVDENWQERGDFYRMFGLESQAQK